MGERRKETIIEQESSDSSICPQNKKAKLDETYLTELIEEDSNVQIVPTAKINTLKHDTKSQDSTEKYTPDQCLSNQTTRTTQSEESPKNEVGKSYEQWSSSDDPIPLLDSSFQSDSFHQVPGSPSDYPTEELQVVEELFPPVADDVTKSKCTQGANNSLYQYLDSDNEDHTVPSELSVSDLYRERLYLKKGML